MTAIRTSSTLQITRNYLTEAVFQLTTQHPGTLNSVVDLPRIADLINFKAMFVLSGVDYTQGDEFMMLNYTDTVMELAESQKGIGVGLTENISNTSNYYVVHFTYTNSHPLVLWNS